MGVMRTTNERGAIQFIVDDTEVQKALNASEAGVRTAMREAMFDAGSLLVRAIRDNLTAQGLIATKDTYNSIMAEITGRRGQIELIVGSLDEADAVVAATLEGGRTPGSRMPPKGPILEWLAIKGLDPGMEFPLRRKIAGRGLQGQPFYILSDPFTASESEIERIFDEVLGDVAHSWESA